MAGVAALLVWVRAELRLTEGSVLLTMGEPMGNDSVMFGWGDSVPRET